jgi:hypothetical protein
LPAGAEAPAGWPYVNLTNLACTNEPTTTPGPDGVDTQVMFVNSYTVGGAPSAVGIWQRTLNTTTGLYQRTFVRDLAYNNGFAAPAKESAVFVVTANGSCIRLIRASANPSRFLVKN